MRKKLSKLEKMYEMSLMKKNKQSRIRDFL